MLQTIPQLHAEDGVLYVGETLLMHFYPAGDCDTCPWPMPDTHNHRARLASALYDARECLGYAVFPREDHGAVLLPDGTRFDIEASLRESLGALAAGVAIAAGEQCPECGKRDTESNGATEYRCRDCDHRWGIDCGERYGY